MNPATETYCGVCGEPVLEDEETVMTQDRGTLHSLCYLTDESARWPEPSAAFGAWAAASVIVISLGTLALAAFALYLIAGAFS